MTRRLACVLVAAACETASAAPVAASPEQLARTLAPDVVGTLAITPVTTGDYAMSLGMPMGKGDRVVLSEHEREAPRGIHVVLAPAKLGLSVTVRHEARSGSGMPDYTFGRTP